MSHTSTWKQLERDTAAVLGGQRVTRGANFGKEDVDVEIPDFPSFKVDAKRYKRFRVFSLFDLVKKKYCKNPQDKPILIIRESNRKYVLAVINLNLLGKFLEYIRKKGEQNEFN
jgi:hypothetical protein